jgi:hypothetical protein
VRAGDHLATTYACADLGGRLDDAVYLGDASGTHWRRAPGIGARRSLEAALAFRGRILVPATERSDAGTERVTELVVVEP